MQSALLVAVGITGLVHTAHADTFVSSTAHADAAEDLPIALVECNASAPEQHFERSVLPSNLPSLPPGAFQLALAGGAFECTW